MWRRLRSSFPKNTNDSVCKEICQIGGFEQVVSLGKYLGAPMLSSKVTKSTYNFILEAIQKCLSGWSVDHLSLAGRLTFIQSVISALPSYIMQTALLLSSLCKEIDKITRRFLWGSSSSCNKVSLIAWDKVCLDKEVGGLSINKIEVLNKVFTTKLGWRLVSQPNFLWARILRDKYMKGGDVNFALARYDRSLATWKGIMKGSVWINSTTSCSVGNGSKIQF